MDSKSIIWKVLLVALIHFDICVAFMKALERSKLDGHDAHDIELYIEQKITFIHSKIDLRPTITALVTLNKCVLQMEKGGPDSLSTALRDNLFRRMDKLLSKLKRVSSRIAAPDRSKRSIEFIGNLISDIFGNPGPADWKQANANFLALHDALKKLNDNSLTDHLAIDSNTHSIEKHNRDLKMLSLAINRNQNEIDSLNHSMGGLRMYFEISSMTDILESQVDSLVEIKVDSVKGYCSDRALSRDFLTSNLQSLEANKVGLGPVFGSWEWREYYKHDMCTTAMDNDVLWVTLRIPIVKKAEKLVRYIAMPSLREVLTEADSYGVHVNLFKEKNNEKYHAMAQSALDLCNNLGNIRTCGVRDTRFSVTDNTVVPVEFSVNKFLLVGALITEVNLMEKCPNGIHEHKIKTDVVMMIPNNCTYVSNSVMINAREADVDIMKALGILQFDKFVVHQVERSSSNKSKTSIENIAKHTSNNIFAENKKDIDEMLNSIDTKHETLSLSYSREKWLFAAGLLGLVLLLATVKVVKMIRKRKVNTTGNEKIQIIVEQPGTNDKGTNDTQTDKQKNELSATSSELYDEHEYQELSASTSGSRVNLGSRPERSQFVKK